MPSVVKKGRSSKKDAKAGSKKSSMKKPSAVDGEAPQDFVTHMLKLNEKNKRQVYDNLCNPTRILAAGFLENLERNRAPIPIAEKKRVRAPVIKPEDQEYVPAQYCSLEREEYVIWQAPTKNNYIDFWRCAWKDSIRIMICLSDRLDDADPDQCFPYFPNKEGTDINIEDGRYIINCVKKESSKGYSVYDLTIQAAEQAAIDVSALKNDGTCSDGEEEDPTKPRQLTLFHFEAWEEDKWPNLDHLSQFIQAVMKKECQLLRKTVSSYAAPICIQGNYGIGRSAAVWVACLMYKDIEQRDCMDVEDLIKRFMKMRCGGFSAKIYFFVAFALAFRCAGLSGWITPGECNKYVKEIADAYEASNKK